MTRPLQATQNTGADVDDQPVKRTAPKLLLAAIPAALIALGSGCKEESTTTGAPPASPDSETSPAKKPEVSIVSDPAVSFEPMTDLEASCQEGDAAACWNAGMRYHRGNDPHETIAADQGAAMRWFEKGCNLDHTRSCVVLATLTGQGRGGEPDQRAAAAIFERACELGDAEACQHLGVRYYQGNGRSKDVKRARELMSRACTARAPKACADLSVIYGNGEGVPKNPDLAMDLLERACKLADKHCGFYAFKLHSARPETPPAKLEELMRRGCEGGDIKACKALRSTGM